MTYAIFEGNMERLEKKLNKIYNKCRAFGCSFHYEQVGETFKEVKDEKGNTHMARFILVEAEGTAIVNNWEFVATVEHTEKGNVFSGISGIEVPARYYGSEPVCEHCNTSRYRKYTYIVRNKETGEFKQVGKSCLKDFTNGMSAEAVAQYMSMFDTLIEGEAPEPGCHIENYLDKEEYLKYAAETIRHFGYVKAGGEETSTALRALDYYEADRNRAVTRDYLEYLKEEMNRVGFDAHSPEVEAQVKDALDWIAGQNEISNYIHNLKTVCGLNYVARKNFGLLASLFPAYNREMEKMAKWKDRYGDESKSKYVGSEGDTITADVKSVRCMTSYDTPYGVKRIYKFIDKTGNVYIWKTGTVINNESSVISVAGTVKGHREFRGFKQTELTRCKITKAE